MRLDVLPAFYHTSTMSSWDTKYPEQWFLNNTGQSNGTPDADIDAPEAWQITTGSSSVKIGIIDTGVETSHDDLSGKSSGDQPESTPYDGYSHGTHVAGIAGAKVGGGDVIGVASSCPILSRKVFSGYVYNPNTGTDEPAWAGDNVAYNKITNAVDNGAAVLNNSYGGDTYSTVLREAFAYVYKMNRVAVVSMGNDYNNGNPTKYPAAFGEGIIAVGATTDQDTRSSFSQTGSYIDVVAPGGENPYPNNNQHDIMSTWRGDSYRYLAGTSMAAPQVTGTAALLKSYNSSLYNDDIEHIIQLSADKIRPDLYTYDSNGWNINVGYGRINAYKALNMLRSPYVLLHHTVTGGTDYSSSSFSAIFYGVTGLTDGQYYVERHEVRKTISYSYMSSVHVWGDGVGTDGWSIANPNFGMGWSEPVNGTVGATSATLHTYVYKVYDTAGNFIGWFPNTPSNVQFTYTVSGIPSNPPSVYISGPTEVQPYTYPTWTANPSGGTTPYQYNWQMRYVPWGGGSWTSWSNFGNQQSEGMTYSSSIYEVELKVTITDADSKTASDTFYAYFNHTNAITSLSDPTPNPFNPTTVLNYSLAKPAHVKLMIYNILGQRVATLVDANQAAGKYRKTFDASPRFAGPAVPTWSG